MDTALERIREKIAELETKIVDLRIAERELQALEKPTARRAKQAPEPEPKPKRVSKKASEPAEARQTIGSAIAAVLEQHGALSAAEIAEHIKATGRDISNRTVSFALQALKKRGLVKNADGQWTPPKSRSRQASA
jgi:ribosomal protein L9